MRRLIRLAAGLTVLALFAGCMQRDTGAEFVLPSGDPDKGQELFVSYGCYNCHSVPNLDLPEGNGPVKITLGGRVSKVKTYPELVTSVINPSHKFVPRRRPEEVSEGGESLMTVYNDVMTVTELVDLVSFLESRYEVLERPGYRYPTYSVSE